MTTPYPGESLAIFDAAAITGLGVNWGLGSVVQKRAEAATLAAGDEWRAWVSPGADYLDGPDVDAVVSWVVEVTSGTVTLTASEGRDPDYGDPYLTPPTPLGSHTVTGPATLVIPSTIPVADVWDSEDAFMLVLGATSGAAVVHQVKLRVWPPTGPLGGWSDLKPSWSGEWIDTPPRYRAFNLAGESTTDDVETSWDGAWSGSTEASDALDGPYEFSAVEPDLNTYADQVRPNLTEYFTGLSVKAALALIIGRDWRTEFGIDDATYVSGVDWIRPPSEVSGDFTTFTQQAGEGDVEWNNASVVLTATTSANPLGGVNLYSESFDDLATTPGVAPGSLVADVDLHAGLPAIVAGTGGGYVTKPLATGGRFLLVSITHSSMLETGVVPGWPGTTPSTFASVLHQCLASADFGVVGADGIDPIQSRVVMPPYRMWTLAPPARRKPLQWSQRKDGAGMDGVTSWANGSTARPATQWRAPN